MNVLLQGIVGSTAYGLAHEGSDIDRMAVFAEPTRNLVGLRQPDESRVTTKPDVTQHEAAKLLRLVLNGNPSVSELLWLQDYEVKTDLGAELVLLRTSLLSAKRVRNAYMGYALSQASWAERQMINSPETSLLKNSSARAEKYCRHLIRLVEQGYALYTTGYLSVDLSDIADIDWVRETAVTMAREPQRIRNYVDAATGLFDRATSVLPEHPNQGEAEQWLAKVREAYWTKE